MALCLLLRLFRNKETDRKSGSAGMPRPNSYAVFCLKKKTCVDHAVAVDIDCCRRDYTRARHRDTRAGGEKTHLVCEVSGVGNTESEVDSGLATHDVGTRAGIRRYRQT